MKTYTRTITVQAAKIITATSTYLVVEGENGPERMSLGRNWIGHHLPQPGQYLVVTEPGRYMVMNCMKAEGFVGPAIEPPKPKAKKKLEKAGS